MEEVFNVIGSLFAALASDILGVTKLVRSKKALTTPQQCSMLFYILFDKT
ncbi:hypothetical protein [Liquorilactobacillus uvarum]|nr:hypothetical protein [Liquorilactobacillus uvarum]